MVCVGRTPPVEIILFRHTNNYGLSDLTNTLSPSELYAVMSVAPVSLKSDAELC